MGEAIGPDDLTRRLREIERRLAALETAPRLKSAAMRNGLIEIVDDVGTVRTRLGLLPNGDYGVEAYNSDGIRVFSVGDNGMARPAMILPWFDSFDLAPPRTITQGSFGSFFNTRAPFVSADGLVLSINVGTDVGTTGELRVTIFSTAGNVTSAVNTLGSGLGGGGGGTGPRTLRWLHGLQLGVNDLTMSVQVELRRTGGAGNVYAVVPNYAFFVDGAEFSCTGSGGTWS
jgi:hypothetical protein